MRIRFIFFILFFPHFCYPQAEVYMGDISGPPLKEKRYTDIIGSPYFLNQWAKGQVVFTNGQNNSNLLLSYDEFTGELSFKYSSGEAMKFLLDVDFFTIEHTDSISGNEIKYKFVSLNLDGKRDFFQSYSWSEKDMFKFYVRRRKKVYTTQVYNSATKTNTFENNYTYFIKRANSLSKIKLNEKSLESLLSSEQQESRLKDYIKMNNLKVSKVEDFAKIISFINSLFQEVNE